jgi:hypothetical protein
LERRHRIAGVSPALSAKPNTQFHQKKLLRLSAQLRAGRPRSDKRPIKIS